jgi:E3 ubiquitin-protein ligase DOA10
MIPHMRHLDYMRKMSNKNLSRTNLSDGETCRLCYDVEMDDNNPMISICKCKGTLNNIHLGCLKLWLEQKLTMKEIFGKCGTSYIVKSFNCEICKEPYPSTIFLN